MIIILNIVITRIVRTKELAAAGAIGLDNEPQIEYNPNQSLDQVLNSLELIEFANRFEAVGITTLDDLANLTKERMKELGLKSSKRAKLTKWIELVHAAQGQDMDQIQKYAQLFESIDDDGNGGISMEEFKQALLALNRYQNDKQAKKLFEYADMDKSGTIDFNEFVRLVQYMKVQEGKE